MFSVLERDVIMRDYFKMHIVASSMVEFQSMNGDWWVVFNVECRQTKQELMRRAPKQHRYVLYHKHADGVGYHEHGQYCNVVDAMSFTNTMIRKERIRFYIDVIHGYICRMMIMRLL